MLISGEDPDLDACETEVSDGVWDTVLQLVFNGGGAEEGQVFLDVFVDLIHSFVAVHQRSAAPSVHYSLLQRSVDVDIEML